MRHPSKSYPTFTVSFNGNVIGHKEERGEVACVQDFVRNPLFTQRNIFSETGISRLDTAVAAAAAV